jgi:hypothetical protein
MNAQPQTIPQPRTEPVQPQPAIPRWNLALQIAFRFWMIYLGLYCLATQMIISLFTGPVSSLPDPATVWPLRPVISWTAAHIFHVNAPLTVFWGGNSSSTDCMFGWVTAFCVLMIATVATGVWSLLDRRRENYAPSRRRPTRTGRRASPSDSLPGTGLSWTAGWTIIRFIWSFS